MDSHPHHPSMLHPVAVGYDIELGAVALAAARSFLRAQSRAEVALMLHAAVSSLGGVLVPAHECDSDALPLDVSLGVGEVQLVVTAAGKAAALDRLARVVPALVEDALVAAAQCDSFEQQALRASVDELTGVSSRREIRPQLCAATRGDIVCLIDLDEFKELNDTYGHSAGDEALRRFGETLRAWFRDDDFVSRYGGDEFLIVLKATRLPVAVERIRALARDWASEVGQLPTVSAGVARVDARGGAAALRAADRALYRAKRRGRNVVEAATLADARAQDAR